MMKNIDFRYENIGQLWKPLIFDRKTFENFGHIRQHLLKIIKHLKAIKR